MTSRSDAHSHAARRRHAILQGLEEVFVDLHRLGIAGGRSQRLGDEPLSLLERIGQLRVRRALFGCEDDQIPLLGQPWIVAMLAGEGRILLGEIGVEDRRRRRALAQFAVDLLEDVSPGGARFEFQPNLSSMLM
jgi:hypothetical protein